MSTTDFPIKVPNIRVDDDTIDLIKRVQGFYLFTAGERMSQGEAVKRVLAASIDELVKESV